MSALTFIEVKCKLFVKFADPHRKTADIFYVKSVIDKKNH